MSAPAPAGPHAALNRLASALGPQFSTTLVQRAGHRPHLVVVDRHTQAATDVYADERGRYRWPWARPAAATDDPLAAAQRVASMLRENPGTGL